jgi:transcription termination factor NusB
MNGKKKKEKIIAFLPVSAVKDMFNQVSWITELITTIRRKENEQELLIRKFYKKDRLETLNVAKIKKV